MSKYARAFALLASFLVLANGQQAGNVNPEVHPSLTSSKCTKAGGCKTQSTKIVLDSNWRWLHDVNGYDNCYTGTSWDSTLCPDPSSCAQNCALDGAQYQSTYGISTSGNALTLKFVTGGNVGSRVYLMDPTDTKYQLLQLKNQEFTFDVDASQLPCGVNGAVYLTGMDADGGLSRFASNKAGAAYGTGYCDAQCPQDLKFINGQANLINWNPNTATGQYGTCCAEMDLWESNSFDTAFTGHPCSVTSQTQCSGTSCGQTGYCDKAGCDFNPYRMGAKSFFGPGTGNTVNSNSKVTVVTQFITSNNTAAGTLTQVKRLYVQNNKVIANVASKIAGVTGNSITDAFCTAQKTKFGDTNTFKSHGGMAALNSALSKGMVLTMSLWDDHAAQMLWLDSVYPVGGNPSTPGVLRGPCPTNSGAPSSVEASYPNIAVTFSNIKWGDINSTYTH